MKLFATFVYLVAAACCAQTAPATPPLEEGTVLATLDDGKRFTYADFKILMGALPPEMQRAAQASRKSFISQYALMRKLSMMAERNKLDQRSPTREVLEYNRMQALTTALLNHVVSELKVTPEDVKAYYDAQRDRYSQVQVKAIYVSFVSGAAATATDGRKSLTEAQARLKIEALLKQIRGGADFVKLVRQHSEDQASAAKDGDFGNLRRTDNLPDAVRNAIFALKEGEVSEPVRQPNGFYLFRVEKIVAQPIEQVRDEIFNKLRDELFRKWMEETQAGVKVTFENETFFNQPAPGAAPPAPPAK